MIKTPTEAELRRLCERWQGLLRLQNWKIKIFYAHTREMVDESGNVAWGRCALNDNHLRAKVLVLHPADYENDDGREEIETTVVHELMHVLMNGVRTDYEDPQSSAEIAEERTINVSSELLVNLLHLGEPKGKKRK